MSHHQPILTQDDINGTVPSTPITSSTLAATNGNTSASSAATEKPKETGGFWSWWSWGKPKTAVELEAERLEVIKKEAAKREAKSKELTAKITQQRNEIKAILVKCDPDTRFQPQSNLQTDISATQKKYDQLKLPERYSLIKNYTDRVSELAVILKLLNIPMTSDGGYQWGELALLPLGEAQGSIHLAESKPLNTPKICTIYSTILAPTFTAAAKANNDLIKLKQNYTTQQKNHDNACDKIIKIRNRYLLESKSETVVSITQEEQKTTIKSLGEIETQHKKAAEEFAQLETQHKKISSVLAELQQQEKIIDSFDKFLTDANRNVKDINTAIETAEKTFNPQNQEPPDTLAKKQFCQFINLTQQELIVYSKNAVEEKNKATEDATTITTHLKTLDEKARTSVAIITNTSSEIIKIQNQLDALAEILSTPCLGQAASKKGNEIKLTFSAEANALAAEAKSEAEKIKNSLSSATKSEKDLTLFIAKRKKHEDKLENVLDLEIEKNNEKTLGDTTIFPEASNALVALQKLPSVTQKASELGQNSQVTLATTSLGKIITNNDTLDQLAKEAKAQLTSSSAYARTSIASYLTSIKKEQASFLAADELQNKITKIYNEAKDLDKKIKTVVGKINILEQTYKLGVDILGALDSTQLTPPKSNLISEEKTDYAEEAKKYLSTPSFDALTCSYQTSQSEWKKIKDAHIQIEGAKTTLEELWHEDYVSLRQRKTELEALYKYCTILDTAAKKIVDDCNITTMTQNQSALKKNSESLEKLEKRATDRLDSILVVIQQKQSSLKLNTLKESAQSVKEHCEKRKIIFETAQKIEKTSAEMLKKIKAGQELIPLAAEFASSASTQPEPKTIVDEDFASRATNLYTAIQNSLQAMSDSISANKAEKATDIMQKIDILEEK
jgi:hypothetical protein